MPKQINIPPYIRDLESERIIELNEKPILPASFQENFSVNLPYTIPASSEFSFSYTFPGTPSQVLLTDVYRFGEASTSSSTDYDYFNLKLGRVTISIIRESCVYLFDGTQTKLFWWGTEGEISEGVLTQSEYGSVVSSPTFFGYSPNQNHSHICHLDSFGKKIVLKGYTVEGNTLKVTFFNEETTPVTLNKFTTIEAKNTLDNLFSGDFKERGICAIGDKIMVFGDKFIDVSGTLPQDWIESRSNIYVMNSNYNTLEHYLDTPKTIMSPQHGFVDVDQGTMDSNIVYLVGSDRGAKYNLGAAGSVKHNNPDEYFAAFMIGYLENDPIRFVLYDSETEKWQLKNSTDYVNSGSGIYTGIKSKLYDSQMGKKPLDIKHFASTGNVHALVTAFTGNYEPTIIYSNSNLETWSTLFSLGDLATVNSNIVSPSILSTTTGESERINKSLLSKIIDENTMFSEFCTYVNNYDFGYNIHRAQVQVLIKTTDGGSTWTDVMKDHPEYTLSPTVCNYISDDGQDIYTMIFYGPGSSVAGHTDARNSLYPSGQTFKILFNYSNDGGTTWAYSSGNWKLIEETNNNTFLTLNHFKFKTQFDETTKHRQRIKNQCGIYHIKETNEIIVVYADLSAIAPLVFEFRISRDNGNTWVSHYSPSVAPFLFNTFVSFGDFNTNDSVPFDVNSVPPNLFSGNDLFASFNIYSKAKPAGSPVLTNPFSVHDYIFESTSYGYTSLSPGYEDSRMPKSSLKITHTNESAKITRLKGYYL